MFFHPRLRVRNGLEDPPPFAHVPLDESSVDEKQQNDGPLMKRHRGPITRVRQVIFQVQAAVSHGFAEQRGTVLVITMQAIMSQVAHPVTR